MSGLEVRGFSAGYGRVEVLHALDLKLDKGEIVTVIGPNGAGKSSLFNLISGAIRPSAGTVRFDGQDVTAQAPNLLLGSGLSRSFQITNLFFELSVRENLRLAAQFLERGRGLFKLVQHSQVSMQRVNELLSQFELAGKAGELAGYLSHGEQRRLEIAVSMASRPRMLLLDEPTQGMSHTDTRVTENLIRGLSRDHGLSILLVEHDVDLVMQLSDHVVVMHQGQKLAEGTPTEVRANPAVQAAYFGEKH